MAGPKSDSGPSKDARASDLDDIPVFCLRLWPQSGLSRSRHHPLSRVRASNVGSAAKAVARTTYLSFRGVPRQGRAYVGRGVPFASGAVWADRQVLQGAPQYSPALPMCQSTHR